MSATSGETDTAAMLARERERLESAIAARERAEEELRQQSELLALAHDAIIVRDPRGRIISWNDGATELYGWTASEAVGQITHDLLRTRVLPGGESGDVSDQALDESNAWQGDLQHSRRDGTTVVVESRQSLLRDADGSPSAILEVNRDATDREHLARLHRVTAALSAATNIGEVASVILDEGMKALGADAGVVSLLAEDGTHFKNVRVVGYVPLLADAWADYPTDAPLPVADAVRRREPLFFESLEERAKHYPHLSDVHRKSGGGAIVAVPLVIGDRVIGGFGMRFAAPRRFSREERTVVASLGELCTQAMDRARLFEDEQDARNEADLQRDRLHEFFMQAPAVIVIVRGPNHAIDFANAHFLKLVGNGDVTGRPLSELSGSVDISIVLAMLDRVRATGEPSIANDLELVTAGNGARAHITCFNVVCQPVRDGSGPVDGILIHGVDVTEQVMARREVERLAIERESVLGQIADGVVIADAGRDITFLNEAAKSMFGMHSAAVAFERLNEVLGLFTPDGAPFPTEEMPLVRAMRERSKIATVDMLIKQPSGSELPVQVNAAPIITASGTVAGAVATFRDVSAARDFERQREEFLSGVAHDLKNPVTVMLGQAQLLQRLTNRDAHDQERVTEGLQVIEARARTLNGLIDDLMDVTRLRMRQPLQLNRRHCDLTQLLLACIDQLPASERHRIRLEGRERLLTGWWDPSRLSRVIDNLVSNALKFSDPGSPVRVLLASEERQGITWAVVTVEDEGMGIPPEDLPRIFDWFYRARNAEQTVSGTGIGLAGAWQIVEQHGGAIEVTSEEGKGSRFTIALPVSEP